MSTRQTSGTGSPTQTNGLWQNLQHELRSGLDKLAKRMDTLESKFVRFAESNHPDSTQARDRALRELSKKSDQLQLALSSQKAFLEDKITDSMAQLEDKMRQHISSPATNSTVRWRKDFDMLSSKLVELEDLIGKNEVESKMSMKELQVMFKVELLETAKEFESKLHAEAAVLRTLTHDVEAKHQETNQNIEAVTVQLGSALDSLRDSYLSDLVAVEDDVYEKLTALVDMQDNTATGLKETQDAVQQLESVFVEHESNTHAILHENVQSNRELLQHHQQMLLECNSQIESIGSSLTSLQTSFSEELDERAAEDSRIRSELESTSRLLEARSNALAERTEVLDRDFAHYKRTQQDELNAVEASIELNAEQLRLESQARAESINGIKVEAREREESLRSELGKFDLSMKKLEHLISKSQIALDGVRSDMEDSVTVLKEVTSKHTADIRALHQHRHSQTDLNDVLQHDLSELSTTSEKNRGELLQLMKAIAEQRRETDANLSRRIEEEMAQVKDTMNDSNQKLGHLEKRLTEKELLLHEVERRLSVALEDKHESQSSSLEQITVLQQMLKEARVKSETEERGRLEAENLLNMQRENLSSSRQRIELLSSEDKLLRDELERAQDVVSQLDSDLLRLKAREWYRCAHPDDPIDVAVSKFLCRLKLPMRIEFKRLTPGTYMADRKLQVKLSQDKLVVRRGGGYQPLLNYLESLYLPVLENQYGTEVAKSFFTDSESTSCNESPRTSP